MVHSIIITVTVINEESNKYFKFNVTSSDPLMFDKMKHVYNDEKKRKKD